MSPHPGTAMIAASIFTDFWDRISDHHLQGLYLVLVGFILSFAFIRMSTRLMRSPKVPWWPGSIVSEGGVHIHHLVFGIVTMMVAGAGGFASFGESPWMEICAFAFGVGAGLTIDEFALWVYLDDVYWQERGRASVDAAVLAGAFMMLMLIGARPFELSDGDASVVLGGILSIAISIAAALVSLLKQRLWHGTIGLFISPLAIYGALRLGKPHSYWAKRRYGTRNPGKQARSEARFPPDRRTERIKDAIRDAIGGSTEDRYLEKISGRDGTG